MYKPKQLQLLLLKDAILHATKTRNKFRENGVKNVLNYSDEY